MLVYFFISFATLSFQVSLSNFVGYCCFASGTDAATGHALDLGYWESLAVHGFKNLGQLAVNERFLFLVSSSEQASVLCLWAGGHSCHYSAAAVTPRRKVQTTLTNLVVKGTDSVIRETRQKLGNFVSQDHVSFSGLHVCSLGLKMVTVHTPGCTHHCAEWVTQAEGVELGWQHLTKQCINLVCVLVE